MVANTTCCTDMFYWPTRFLPTDTLQPNLLLSCSYLNGNYASMLKLDVAGRYLGNLRYYCMLWMITISYIYMEIVNIILYLPLRVTVWSS